MTEQCKKIAIDADSLHTKIRTILLNLCSKKNIELVFVADRPLREIQSLRDKYKLNIKIVRVETGEDSADNWIVSHIHDFLCVITHDIPLAKRIADENGTVIDERGTLINSENAGTLLSVRDYMTKLREFGIYEKSNSTQALTEQDIKKFADTINAFVIKNIG